MIFLSLRVTADAEGGLKGPARPRRSLRGLGGVSHQQASAGIYRRIACRYLIWVVRFASNWYRPAKYRLRKSGRKSPAK